MNTKLKIFTLLALLLWTGASAQISTTPPQRSTPADSLKPMKANSLMNSTAETYMQIIDYSWHIRGGLSGINLNSSVNAIPNSSENDLLSYKLEYETAGQWSGSIGKQSWNHVNGTVPVGVRSYTFTYDGLSRLKTATYSGLGSENYGIPNINYDRNGNITQLQRNGKTGGSFGLMDNLTYTYTGNRLTAVNDAVSGSYEVDFVKRGSGTYSYYANGALKSDENEEITNIVYNTYLNLPEEITLSGGRWIKYTYDGEGKLLKTEYSTGEYWEYIDEFVFKNGQPYQAVIADGRARYESGNWVNEFDYKDHLGNTRVSFKEGSTGAELTAKTDFDPWGVRLNGTGVVNSYSNRWEMRGKEKEMTFGLNRVDYGARVYNPTIGRWDKVDPMAEQYYPYSTFNYTLNNPVSNTDPNGMWVERGGGLFTDNPEEIAAFMDRIRGNGGGDDKDKNKKKEDGNSTKPQCTTCLDPSTVGKNLFGLTYPGGNNPKNYLGDYDYSYQPTNIAEYPAIGHDRRYDQLKIEGASGLFTDTRAIGADWKFVSEELKIVSNGVIPTERLQALGLGIGLGLAATPKTMYKFLVDKNAGISIYLDYKVSNIGVTNKPDAPKRK